MASSWDASWLGPLSVSWDASWLGPLSVSWDASSPSDEEVSATASFVLSPCLTSTISITVVVDDSLSELSEEEDVLV